MPPGFLGGDEMCLAAANCVEYHTSMQPEGAPKQKTSGAAAKEHLQSERLGSPFCSFKLDQRADSPAIHRTEVGVYELRV